MESTLPDDKYVNPKVIDPKIAWHLYIDRFVGTKHQGAGFILKSSHGTKFAYTLKYYFHASNNESEYKALLAGLCIALVMNIDQLIVHRDSQIFHGHIIRMFDAKDENTRKYYEITKKLLSQFDCSDFVKVSRKNNQKVDELSKALSGDLIPEVRLEPLAKKRIDNHKELLCVTPKSNWMIPIKEYILDGLLPDDTS